MERKIEFSLKNISFYLLGFFILGLGIILMLRANLGAGPWDTVTANLKDYLNSIDVPVTLGTMSFVIAATVMLIVLLYTRKWVLLGMLVPMLVIASIIDFWDLVAFANWHPTNMVTRVGISLGGAVLIPLGLSLVIASNFPAFVFDELTIMFMNIFKVKSIFKVRVAIEFLGTSLGVLFGFLAGYTFGEVGPWTVGAVGPASILVVLMLPPLLELFVSTLKQITNEQFKRHLRHVIFYAFGCTFIALGVVLMLRSNVGNSSWDSLHFSLSKALPITLGNATILVAVIVTFAVILLNRNIKYLFMFVPIFLVGFMIDFFNLIALVEFQPESLITQIPTYIIGITILPLGGSLLIISTYPAGVFDELMLVIGRKLHTDKIMLIRVIMELTAVTLAFIIGVSIGIGTGVIGVGTLIFSFSVGVFIQFYLKTFERMNLYENKQTN